MTVTTRSKFWGPLFPDVRGVTAKPFWGPLFPDPGDPLDLVAPTGSAGVATFVLDLEDGMDVAFEWQTDIFKAYDGSEQRVALLEYPRRRISGQALLIGGGSVLRTRAQLARFAASGQPFLLGLPFEALLLTGDAASTTVTVAAGAIAACDWTNPGQRAIVLGTDRTALEAVVQAASGVTIDLDIAAGAVGAAGGYIMPAIAVYLDPQQDFARYRTPDGIERWSITARAATFGFQKSPRASTLDIEATYPTTCGNWVGVILQAREVGIAGDAIRVEADNDSLSGADFAEVGTDVTLRFQPGITTVGEMTALINANATLIKCVGAWNEGAILGDGPPGADTFALTQLDGGSDGDYAGDGTGAIVATHALRPVFDRGLLNPTTIDDAMQAMNEIVDFGGVPSNVGQAETPDWSRMISVDLPQDGEWQWMKRFLGTVRGRQRAFWLPTWRRDLVPVSSSPGELTIEGPSDDDGGFFTWYPARTDIQIRQADGSITRATISAAVDNGDGTITLTTGVTLSGSPIEMVSWLELCRFESDAITIRFEDARFRLQTIARVVTR